MGVASLNQGTAWHIPGEGHEVEEQGIVAAAARIDMRASLAGNNEHCVALAAPPAKAKY